MLGFPSLVRRFGAHLAVLVLVAVGAACGDDVDLTEALPSNEVYCEDPELAAEDAFEECGIEVVELDGGADRPGEPVTPPGESPEPGAPVSDAEARGVLDGLVEAASARTLEAMERVCEMSSMECLGLSGSILHASNAPLSAPGPDRRPSVVCSRMVSDSERLLVIEGRDGLGRMYVSHLVFDRLDDEVRLLGEPAFWLGVVYNGDKFAGSTGWTTTHHPQPRADARDPDALMDRARSACDSGADQTAASADLASFCSSLVELDQAPVPDGGNNAEAITELISVAPSEIRSDLRIVRDYHRNVYVHGDPATDTIDRMPGDVQSAGARVEAYAAEHCDRWPG